MGWQTELLEAVEDFEITHEEATEVVSGIAEAAVYGMVIVAVMTMLVKQFYSVLGPKKFAEEREEVLELVEEIW